MTKKFDELNKTFNVDADIVPVETKEVSGEIEKIASLSEGINFDSLDQYRDKIKIIKESYLNGETKPTQSAQSSIMESDQIAPVNLNEDMSIYVQSISKQLKASNPKVK